MGKKLSFSEKAIIKLKNISGKTVIGLCLWLVGGVIFEHYDLIKYEFWKLLMESPLSFSTATGIIFACLGIAATLYLMNALTKDFETFSVTLETGVDRIVEAIENLGSTSSNPSHNNPNPPRNPTEDKVKTNGTGAFAGMIAGGAIGLLFGPGGVILGGLLGAAVGNQREYNQELERKKRCEKKK